MRTIMMSYPQFRLLPKGVRRMLVTSEQHFFDELNDDSLKRVGQQAQKRQNRAALKQREWAPNVRRAMLDASRSVPIGTPGTVVDLKGQFNQRQRARPDNIG